MRIEKDSMGEMEVPEEALYGASTQRAVLNFPVSDLRLQASFIRAVGVIKYSAAVANNALEDLDEKKAKAIKAAAQEVIDGKLNDQFVVDVFQTGSGTSTNMNANEVIANRALEILGSERGDKSTLHPNDHVNMAQSSNDVIPTAIHVSACCALQDVLLPALDKLASALEKKGKQFENVIKSGRTHLQDATPITLGQEFGGYAAQIRGGIARVERSQESMRELALGGTAVGTGLNTHPEFADRAIEQISKITGFPFKQATNHFEAQGARDAVVELSGQLKTLACSLLKIANDIRWLAAGPRCSLGEIRLPEIQPGSSIMPAKVNPVICESVMMVSAQVIGNDACITVGGQHGNFELNVMLPVIGYNILQSIELIASCSENFVAKCIDGIEANEEVCRDYAEKSLATCTSLAPVIGYDKAAAIAKQAYKENKTVREVASESGVLDAAELDKVLDSHVYDSTGSIMSDYDSFLLVSFGGPEGPDDVMPFLRNVVKGRNIPDERLAEVGEHYYQFGGISPINEQNRALIAELSLAFIENDIHLPIYWGNRNWAPYIPEALAEMKQAGKKKALAFFTSIFSSYSGCRQYRENIAVAQEEVGSGAPEVHKLRMGFNHPGFISASCDRLADALQEFPEKLREKAVVLFSAHSIPCSMSERSDYVLQLEESSRLIAGQSGVSNHRIVYQSRSGSPHTPWLEPDVCDVITELAEAGEKAVVVVPLGFVSDHMEVIFDLDVEAKKCAQESGIPFARAGTVGTHPAFVKMIVELIQERVSGAQKQVVGSLGPWHDTCPKDCCHYHPPKRPTS